MLEKHLFTVAERFLRYVQIDTQSDPKSRVHPSTEKQKDLGRLLVEALQAMGITDAALDEYGYVYATIPANTTKQEPEKRNSAQKDTAPDCTGKVVIPIVHRAYD